MLIAAVLACAPVAIDGDTLRCGRERIRLIGIDAPELPGHCRRGRKCVPGDAQASKRSLQAALRGRATIRRFGFDRYGRTLASVAIGGNDLSCHQLRAGAAAYVARWDTGGTVRRECGR
ncbi:thermonuclease family protein [Sphingomonas hengshuiensis]|nr:thermonuclease family protein [Sphingomonas hengshuiensis]